MELENYPKATAILRGYTYEEAMLVIRVLSEFKHFIGVEVTTNNSDHLKIIHDGKNRFGDKISIGVGTVVTVEQAEEAIEAGAEFMLGPQKFNDKIFKLAKRKGVLTIPGAMSPTEIFKMFEMGADIVKVFPANCLGPEYFNQVQAPLGSLPLMAVGGVDQTNAQNYLNNGAFYVGIGSKFFEKSAVHQLNYERLMELAESFIDSLRVE